MTQTWSNIILNVWATLGPLVGVLIGAYITNRNQKQRWVADNKKQEYRELLTMLTEAHSGVVSLYSPDTAPGPEDQRTFDRAETKSVEIIFDRIFIADEMKRLAILERWQKALHNVHRTGDTSAFSDQFVEITEDIRKSATRIIG